MKILSKLSKLKTSAQFDEIGPEIEAEISAAQARVDEFKERLRQAPFQSAGRNLATARQNVREAESDLELLQQVAEEVQQRRRAASQAEREAEIDAVIAETQKAQGRLLYLHIELFESLIRLKAVLDEAVELDAKVYNTNAFAKEHGRPGVAVAPLVGRLAKSVGVPVSNPLRDRLLLNAVLTHAKPSLLEALRAMKG